MTLKKNNQEGIGMEEKKNRNPIRIEPATGKPNYWSLYYDNGEYGDVELTEYQVFEITREIENRKFTNEDIENEMKRLLNVGVLGNIGITSIRPIDPLMHIGWATYDAKYGDYKRWVHEYGGRLATIEDIDPSCREYLKSSLSVGMSTNFQNDFPAGALVCNDVVCVIALKSTIVALDRLNGLKSSSLSKKMETLFNQKEGEEKIMMKDGMYSDEYDDIRNMIR